MPDEMVAKVPQKLFTPFKIGRMELKNRLAMAPVGAIFSPYDQITQRFKDFYIARARGGVGMIIMAGVVFTDIDRPLSPSIPGIECSNVMTAWDVLAGKSSTGGRVLIIGGDALGLETADFLAAEGKKVVVVEMLDRVGRDLGPTVRFHLQHRLSAEGVQSVTSAKVEKISSNGGLITRGEKQEVWKDFDTIVLATGSKSRSELADEIKGEVKEVYVIGDAARPRNGMYAIREGFEIGRTI